MLDACEGCNELRAEVGRCTVDIRDLRQENKRLKQSLESLALPLSLKARIDLSFERKLFETSTGRLTVSNVLYKDSRSGELCVRGDYDDDRKRILRWCASNRFTAKTFEWYDNFRELRNDTAHDSETSVELTDDLIDEYLTKTMPYRGAKKVDGEVLKRLMA